MLAGEGVRPRRVDPEVHREVRGAVVFELAQPINVLDLTGDFVTRMGASMEIHSGPRARAAGHVICMMLSKRLTAFFTLPR